MNQLSSIWHTFRKDVVIEWRQKSVLASMMVYVISTVFVIYFSFSGAMESKVWMGIYWIILLFVVVNMTVRTFSAEADRQFYYIRTLSAPSSLIAAKMLYNSVYFVLLSALTLAILTLFFGTNVTEQGNFLLVAFLGSLGLANMFTLLSAMTARISNVALIAILGFPIVIPLLLMSIRLSGKCIDPLFSTGFAREVITLAILDVLIIGLSMILFSYLWRD